MISDNSYLLAIINKTFNMIKFLTTFGIFLARTGEQCRRAHLAAAPAARLSTDGTEAYYCCYMTHLWAGLPDYRPYRPPDHKTRDQVTSGHHTCMIESCHARRTS